MGKARRAVNSKLYPKTAQEDAEIMKLPGLMGEELEVGLRENSQRIFVAYKEAVI